MPTPRAGLGGGRRRHSLCARRENRQRPGPRRCAVHREAFDIDAGIWTPVAPMLIPAMDTAAVAKGGKIYVIGGAAGPDPVGPLLNTVQIYDVAKNTWTMGAPMPTVRANLARATCGNVILALRGRAGPAILGRGREHRDGRGVRNLQERLRHRPDTDAHRKVRTRSCQSREPSLCDRERDLRRGAVASRGPAHRASSETRLMP
jgi:Kelch motif protein